MAKRQEKGVGLIFKGNIAHLAHERALRTLLIASAERLKSLFAQAKFTRTFCFWTIHVPNGINSAIVTPTVTVVCATDRNCCQLLHLCLQPSIGSWSDGEMRDS